MKSLLIGASLFATTFLTGAAAATSRDKHSEPLAAQELNCKVGNKVQHSDDKYECTVHQRGEWIGNTGKTALDANREEWCNTFGFFCSASK